MTYAATLPRTDQVLEVAQPAETTAVSVGQRHVDERGGHPARAATGFTARLAGPVNRGG